MGWAVDSSIFIMGHATLEATAATCPVKDTVLVGLASRTSLAGWAPSVPRTIPRPRSSCVEVPATLQPAPTKLAPRTIMRRHLVNTHRDSFPLLSTFALPPSQQANRRLSLVADELQNRVTLEKLKSLSVIAGTRNLPVSDVIASAGLVKASIRLNARSGLS